MAKETPEDLEQLRKERLADLVAVARENSPFYKELYKELPARIEDTALLPVTNKRELMARYDDWATDREVTYEKAQAFVSDPDLIGKAFLGKYRIAQTSGSTGTRVLFVVDERADAIIAQDSKQMMQDVIAQIEPVGEMPSLADMRVALIIATGGHTAAFSRMTMNAGKDPNNQRKIFSVHTPLPELVSQLNEYQPKVLQGYASTIALLAYEQQAGRLHIHPVFVGPTSEGLSDKEYDNIARAFNATLGTFYGGTECGSAIAWSCKERWLHLNSPWAIVEAVDEEFKPVLPGIQSYSVLVTNLANRVMPIIKYDMGDSIMVRPGKCPCGNPMPAIRVLGRVADVLTFTSKAGVQTKLTSLQLSMIFDRTPGVQLFQIVQTAPTSLSVRLRTAKSEDQDKVWENALGQLGELLRGNGLDYITVQRASEPPEQAVGGKYREVIPLGL